MERKRTTIWPVEALAREVDQLVALALAGSAGSWTPPVDVVESGGRYLVSVDVPGVAAADLTLSLRGRELQVAGWKGPRGEQPTQRRYVRVERTSGRFAVSVALPGPVDPSGSAARLRAGVLEVTLCRIEDRRNQVHTIAIVDEES